MAIGKQYVHLPLPLSEISALPLSKLRTTPDCGSSYLQNPDLLYHTQAHWDQVLCCLLNSSLDETFCILGMFINASRQSLDINIEDIMSNDYTQQNDFTAEQPQVLVE